MLVSVHSDLSVRALIQVMGRVRRITPAEKIFELEGGFDAQNLELVTLLAPQSN